MEQKRIGNSKQKQTVLALALAAGIGAGLPVVTVASGDAPRFVSGGVGFESRAQLAQDERDANLKLVFTEPQGSYLSDVSVRILDRSGNVVVDTATTGPWLLAKLAPGSYRVIAGDGTTRQEHAVTVGGALRTMHVRLPAQDGTPGRPGG